MADVEGVKLVPHKGVERYRCWLFWAEFLVERVFALQVVMGVLEFESAAITEAGILTSSSIDHGQVEGVGGLI